MSGLRHALSALRRVLQSKSIALVGLPLTRLCWVLTPRELFNVGDEANDFAAFGSEVNANIAGLSDQSNADALTPILLPDILTFDTSSADAFLNGRGLEDDVIDGALSLLAATPGFGDGVNANDVGFLPTFPFLAPRNTAAIPEPTGLLPIALAVGAFIGRRRRS